MKQSNEKQKHEKRPDGVELLPFIDLLFLILDTIVAGSMHNTSFLSDVFESYSILFLNILKEMGTIGIR